MCECSYYKSFFTTSLEWPGYKLLVIGAHDFTPCMPHLYRPFTKHCTLNIDKGPGTQPTSSSTLIYTNPRISSVVQY